MTTYNAATTLDNDDDTFTKTIAKANEKEVEDVDYREELQARDNAVSDGLMCVDL